MTHREDSQQEFVEWIYGLIQEWMENLDNHYHLFPGHTDFLFPPLIHLWSQWKTDLSKICIWLHHSFDYHHSMTTTAYLINTRFPGQHPRPAKFRCVCLFSTLFSCSCPHPAKTSQYPELLCWFTIPLLCPSCFLYQDCSFLLAFSA